MMIKTGPEDVELNNIWFSLKYIFFIPVLAYFLLKLIHVLRSNRFCLFRFQHCKCTRSYKCFGVSKKF